MTDPGFGEAFAGIQVAKRGSGPREPTTLVTDLGPEQAGLVSSVVERGSAQRASNTRVTEASTPRLSRTPE
jgi:hypothetical protein